MDQDLGIKISSGVFWRFGERITAQAVSFIVSIIIARILMPEDYGVVAILNVFIAIVSIVVTSGFSTALIQKKDADSLDFSTIFWCNLLLSAVLYTLIFLLAPAIAAYYGLPSLTPLFRVLAVRILVDSVNSIENAYVSRHMDFKKFFFATIIGTVISAVVGIYMAYNGFGAWALVAQILTNATIDTFVLFIIIEWKPRLKFSISRAKPLLKYGWKILATDLIGTVFNHLNSFVIGKRYSASDLAYYTQGKKFPDIVNNNVIAAVSAVLFPAMSLCSGVDAIKRIRRRSLMLMEYIMFPLLLGMCTVADRMILVLLTDKWAFAIPFVRISCISALLGIPGATFVQELKAIGRSDITLKLELIIKPINLIIVLIAMQSGVKAIACTSIVMTIVSFLINLCSVKRIIGYDLMKHLADAGKCLWMAIVMCIIVYILGLFFKTGVISLIIQVLVGTISYIGLSVFSKNESFQLLKQYFGIH